MYFRFFLFISILLFSFYYTTFLYFSSTLFHHFYCIIYCITHSSYAPLLLHNMYKSFLFGCWFSRMYLCFDPYAPPCFRLYKKDIRTARRQSCVYRTAVCGEKICPVSLVSVCPRFAIFVLPPFCFLFSRFRCCKLPRCSYSVYSI